MTKWVSTRKSFPDHGQTVVFKLQSLALEKPKKKKSKREELVRYRVGMFDKKVDRFYTPHLSYTIYRVTHWAPIEFIE
jgi:hypothetical protein